MRLPPFKLDLWLAAHEFASPPIRYNLASSTGPRWTLGEIAALGSGSSPGAALRELDGLTLAYAPPEGGIALRERIAARHGVDPECVLVMTGASEVLMALICHFAAPGASIVVPSPVYPAVPVLARAWGLSVREYRLDPQRAFSQDAASVLAAVDHTTRAVFVNTPHNPTGSVMPAAEQRTLAAALAARGIPLIVDEVYHPLYFGAPVPSASQFENTLVVGDFAKALSLPGLRIGWLIDRDPARRAALLDLRSYFTISCSLLTEAIAEHALAHASAILERLETVTRSNLALLTEFMREHREVLDFPTPAGGTTCFPYFRDGRDARPFCETLAARGVLVAPGDCFDMPAHLRVGFGAQRADYAAALQILGETLDSVRPR